MTAPAANKQCQKCGQAATDLLRVDPGMRLRFQEVLPDVTLPAEVCGSCFKGIAQDLNRGAKLRAEHQAREQNKMMMWRSRVNLVKQGRVFMSRKAYSEAAVSFEKYIRVLEVVYDKKPGELTPELFKDSARTKEITVVASVLWDLVRIYDTSPRYGERQKRAVQKLGIFIQYSPIQGEIVKKARQFEATAKNKGAIKDLIKLIDKKGGRCFIATATYHDPQEYAVRVLTLFRDELLVRQTYGRVFIKLYYAFSPRIALVIDQSTFLQKASKLALDAVAAWLDRRFHLLKFKR